MSEAVPSSAFPADSIALPHLPKALRERLFEGERVLWTQRAPILPLLPGMLFVTAFFNVWAFGAWTWTGVVLWQFSVGELEGAPFALAIGLLFSTMGLFLFFGSWASFIGMFRTFYAITDRRVIIGSELPTPSLSSYSAEHFQPMERVANARGAGAIRFNWGRLGKSGDGYRCELSGLPDVTRVAALITSTLKV